MRGETEERDQSRLYKTTGPTGLCRKQAAGAKHGGSSLTNHQSSRWSAQRPNLANLGEIHAVTDNQGRSTPRPRTFLSNCKEAIFPTQCYYRLYIVSSFVMPSAPSLVPASSAVAVGLLTPTNDQWTRSDYPTCLV